MFKVRQCIAGIDKAGCSLQLDISAPSVDCRVKIPTAATQVPPGIIVLSTLLCIWPHCDKDDETKWFLTRIMSVGAHWQDAGYGQGTYLSKVKTSDVQVSSLCFLLHVQVILLKIY